MRSVCESGTLQTLKDVEAHVFRSHANKILKKIQRCWTDDRVDGFAAIRGRKFRVNGGTYTSATGIDLKCQTKLSIGSVRRAPIDRHGAVRKERKNNDGQTMRTRLATRNRAEYRRLPRGQVVCCLSLFV